MQTAAAKVSELKERYTKLPIVHKGAVYNTLVVSQNLVI